MWLDYISTRNSSLYFQPFCLAANADSIKTEKLFPLHRSKVTSSSVYQTFHHLRFLPQNSSLKAWVFPKPLLKLLAEDTLGLPKRGNQEVAMQSFVLRRISTASVQCWAEISILATGLVLDSRCIQSNWSSHLGTSILWVQPWCHQRPWGIVL